MQCRLVILSYVFGDAHGPASPACQPALQENLVSEKPPGDSHAQTWVVENVAAITRSPNPLLLKRGWYVSVWLLRALAR